MDLGVIAAKMVLNTTQFHNSMDAAVAKIKASGEAIENGPMSKLDALSGKFTTLGGAMTRSLTVPLVAVGGLAVKTAAGFETQMSRVKAISEATGEQFQKLRQQAIDLGASTMFSATEAAAGMENLASAGFEALEIMDAMPGVLDLAAVSGGDVALAAEAMATTLNAFGLEAEDAAHVADVFAEAAARTNAEAADMAEAMKYAAPVAHAMKLEMEEVAAAIGLMADAGIKGSQAGTTLRGAIKRMTAPTEEMVTKMEELGLEFFDQNGQMISLEEQIRQLSTAMKGMTDEQKANILTTLYGTTALSGMMVLVNEGPDALGKMTDSLKNADGAADKMARTMQDNLGAKWEQFLGALESAAIVFTQDIAPTLNLIIGALTKLVEGFVNLPGPIRWVISNLLLFTAATGPILWLIGKVIDLGKHFEWLKGPLGKLKDKLIEMFPTFKQWGGQAVKWLGDIWTSTILPKLSSAGGAILAKLGSVVGGIKGLFSGLWAVLTAPISGPVLAIGAVIAAFGLLYANVEGFRNFVNGVVSAVWTKLTEFFQGIVNWFQQLPQHFANFMAGLGSWAEGIGQWAQQVGEGLAQGTVSVIGAVGQWISGGLAEIGNATARFVTGAGNLVSGFVNGLGGGISQVGQTAMNIVKAVWDPIAQLPNKMLGIGGDIVRGLWNGIKNFLPNLWENVKGIGRGILNSIKRTLGIKSPSRRAMELMAYFGQGLNIGLGKVVNVVGGTAERVAETILRHANPDIDPNDIGPQPGHPGPFAGAQTAYASTLGNGAGPVPTYGQASANAPTQTTNHTVNIDKIVVRDNYDADRVVETIKRHEYENLVLT